MARFVRNPGFERQLARSDEMRAALRRAAEDAAAEARAVAPVDTGEYRSSIRVEESAEGVRVVSDDDKASHIEFGTQDTPAFAPLRRGAEGAGLKVGRSQ